MDQETLQQATKDMVLRIYSTRKWLKEEADLELDFGTVLLAVLAAMMNRSLENDSGRQ